MRLPKNAARRLGTSILSKSSNRPRKIRQIYKHTPLLKLIEHLQTINSSWLSRSNLHTLVNTHASFLVKSCSASTRRRPNPYRRLIYRREGGGEYHVARGNTGASQLKVAALDYSRITCVVRNPMALSQSPTLTDTELKHFNDNSPTTPHLIESLADETYSLHRSRTTET